LINGVPWRDSVRRGTLLAHVAPRGSSKLMHVGVLAVQQAHNSTSASPILLTLAGFVGGFAVGLTGMGGGALMTPALVLLFKVDPKVAVASDLVNSLVMKPIGGSVHARKGTTHWPLVRWMVLGSVP